MQALYSTEEMMALDPMTLQPLNTFGRQLMETPAPISELGKKLLIMAQEGDTDQVRELMSKGAPFTTDWLGTSPLHWACQNNHIETVEVLLRAGISRDARNKVERTPLHVAAQEGHLEILTLLTDFGADVDCKDMLRMTPLHWAAENGHAECVRLLLNNGADPICINKFDKTPDQIAFDNNRLDIVQMIQQIAAMDPMSRPTKQRKEITDKATLQATLSISNSPQKATDEPRVITESNFNKVKTKLVPNASFTKPPVTEIRVMKVSTGKRKIINNEVVEEARVENEMGTIPNPTDKTLQLLQAHGITMLPVDDSNLVASAMQSGQTVVLTEAGKLALNQTLKPITQIQNTPLKAPLISPRVFPFSGKKVIKIRADQLINMTKERKVIIHTDKKFKLNPKRQLDEANKEDGEKQRPAIGELEEIQKQLEEARKQAEMYKEQYLQKEKEAEHYKMQLEAFIIGK